MSTSCAAPANTYEAPDTTLGVVTDNLIHVLFLFNKVVKSTFEFADSRHNFSYLVRLSSEFKLWLFVNNSW